MEKVSSKRSENKSANRMLFIDTAEKLFLEREFERTSMDEIAAEAGLTKRTLYKYFTSKEDLFYAVVLKGEKQLSALCEEAEKCGANALEKIRLINKAYYQFYIEHPAMFRLMNYQPDNMENCKSSPSYAEVAGWKDETLRYFNGIIETGKRDGSINKDLDTTKAVYFGLFSAMGLLNLVSMMDKSFIWHGEVTDERDFLLFSMDLLADALR